MIGTKMYIVSNLYFKKDDSTGSLCLKQLHKMRVRLTT